MRRGENFPLLDGLRGVAALAILLRHAHEFLLGSSDKASAYLAVDFFFMLSGFVVCAAYGRRLENKLSWRRFMTIRLIRLWPMLVIGGLLGGAALTFQQLALDHTGTPWHGVAEGISAALLFPLGLVTGTPVFAANFPIWSLFFEIIVNGLYGIRFGFTKRTWILVTVFWIAVLAVMAIRFGSLDPLGFKGAIGFFGGLPRAIVPFTIGVMVYLGNFHHRIARVSAWIPVVVLMGAFYYDSHPAWVFGLIATLLIFPVLVTAAAASRLGPRATRLTYISGELSYPVYLIHQPMLRIMMVIEKKLLVVIPFWLNVALALAIVLPTAWLLLKFADKPVRRALDRLLLGNKDMRDVLIQPAL
jgi:peptidoglycan/LPS O-acetylase OafA/YrhL